MVEKNLFDFGFTVVSQDEIEDKSDLEDYRERLDKMYKAITPLLENLKQNPEKDLIHWPNRIEKVEAFEKSLTKILNGK